MPSQQGKRNKKCCKTYKKYLSSAEDKSHNNEYLGILRWEILASNLSQDINSFIRKIVIFAIQEDMSIFVCFRGIVNRSLETRRVRLTGKFPETSGRKKMKKIFINIWFEYIHIFHLHLLKGFQSLSCERFQIQDVLLFLYLKVPVFKLWFEYPIMNGREKDDDSQDESWEAAFCTRDSADK